MYIIKSLPTNSFVINMPLNWFLFKYITPGFGNKLFLSEIGTVGFKCKICIIQKCTITKSRDG